MESILKQACVIAAPPQLEPLALTVADAVKFSGLSRSAVYRELAAGNIEAVKHASKTLVLTASLRRYVVSLPMAEFRGRRVT